MTDELHLFPARFLLNVWSGLPPVAANLALLSERGFIAAAGGNPDRRVEAPLGLAIGSLPVIAPLTRGQWGRGKILYKTAGTRVTVLNQNINGSRVVQINSFDMADYQSGTITAYRPASHARQ